MTTGLTLHGVLVEGSAWLENDINEIPASAPRLDDCAMNDVVLVTHARADASHRISRLGLDIRLPEESTVKRAPVPFSDIILLNTLDALVATNHQAPPTPLGYRTAGPVGK
jgi:hypothetical protein